jgi:hypothetical protein
VRVLSRLFRGLFLDKLNKAHKAGELQFFGDHRALANPQAFANWLKPLRQQKWYLYAKRPFAGPEAVLAYLSRYTHRIAIANSRLLALDRNGVTFKWKDYRNKGSTRHKTMTLNTNEFIRRFLIHVLPRGFHRIRHYGWLANATRVAQLTHARELLQVETTTVSDNDSGLDHESPDSTYICPTCAAPMIILETFGHGYEPRAPPAVHES